MGWLYFLHVRDRRFNDDQYRIVAIVQNTSDADALKTVYLAELLDLSLDKPVNIYYFNLQKATEKLLNHPLIKEATIKKILPGTLYIDYQMRTPIAYIGELSNTAIDHEGYLIPFHPFYTPKRLPTLYLNIDSKESQWGKSIYQHPSIQQAFNLLKKWNTLFGRTDNIKQIDVSMIGADSYGQRQAVVIVEEIAFDDKTKLNSPLFYLRLSSDHTEQDLSNFHFFQEAMKVNKELRVYEGKNLEIDFRIPNLAYIKASSSS